MLAQDLLCSPLAFDGGAAAIVALGCPSSQGCDVISETFRSLCGVELPQTGVAEPNLRIYVLILDPPHFLLVDVAIVVVDLLILLVFLVT